MNKTTGIVGVEHKFGFMNISLRTLILLLEAKRKGYLSNQDVRVFYSLHKRSKNVDSTLAAMVSNGYLRRTGYDRYEPTRKAEQALQEIQTRIRMYLR